MCGFICVWIGFVIPALVGWLRCRHRLLCLQEARITGPQLNRSVLGYYTLLCMVLVPALLSIPMLADAVFLSDYPFYAARLIASVTFAGWIALLVLSSRFWDRALVKLARVKVVNYTFLVLHAALAVDALVLCALTPSVFF